MITHLSAREARIWIEWETVPKDALIRYSNPAESDGQFAAQVIVGTDGISNTILNQINPGRSYQYVVEADGGRLIEEFFTAPIHYKDIQQPPAFSVGILGSHYVIEDGTEPPYQVLEGNLDVFPVIGRENFVGLIWAGSTSFLRDMDTTSIGGVMRRHGYNRSLSATRKLFSNIWHKAVPALGNFSAEHSSPTYAPNAWARYAFSKYWPSAADFHLKPHAETPLYHSFRWADTDFFFIDTHSEREGYHQRTESPKLFSDEQQIWLLRALARSDAPFKIVVSATSMLSPSDNPGNFSFADEQQESFLRALERNQFDGIVFISGGKHFGEVTKYVRPRGYSMYEMSVGSTTYLDPSNPREPNFFREPLSYSEVPQFGRLSVSGEEGARVLSLALFETNGNLLFEQVIPQTELQWQNEGL
ncbi:MAG: alkaline phosphatase D family protein [Verrucomicrobiota bacterium]